MLLHHKLIEIIIKCAIALTLIALLYCMKLPRARKEDKSRLSVIPWTRCIIRAGTRLPVRRGADGRDAVQLITP